MSQYVKKADLEAVVLYKLYEVSNADGVAKALHEVVKLFSVPVPQYRVDLALQELESEGFVARNEKNGWKLFRISNLGLRVVEGHLSTRNSVLNQYLQHGEERFFPPIAPASDRLVAIDHNGGPAVEIEEALSSIEQTLTTSNEVGDLLGNERDVAVAEVSALRRVLAATQLRTSTFLQSAKGTLGWIAEKCAGAGVSEAAKMVLKQIMDWLA